MSVIWENMKIIVNIALYSDIFKLLWNTVCDVVTRVS